jgi:histidinol dehydrogenase
MKIIYTSEDNFRDRFDEILQRGKMDMDTVGGIVGTILGEIRESGDEALMEHIARFDRWEPKSAEDLVIDADEMAMAYKAIDDKVREALHLAYERIESYHKKSLPRSWFDYEENGIVTGQKVTPVDRAGLYIPGGKAAYPSSLLMNAIPALVAGVKEIVVTTPTPDREINTLLLAACHLCGIERLYRVGGASAIGAMAYGTETIPKVDVITGPGNIFVATAKKMVYGEVDIDMIAGPSEIGILADTSARADWVAIDLLSQAEHDEMASSILITDDEQLAIEVSGEVEGQIESLERKDIALKSIVERGAIIVANDMIEAVELMNEIAPEHLEVMTSAPMELVPYIKHAGAIFLGHFTPEPIGDYIAGPNHTLPTGGTAKFYSPLSVENFMKKSSIIMMSREGMSEIGEACATIARIEGLTAHEKSVLVRL